jgi:hypothetical protein
MIRRFASGLSLLASGFSLSAFFLLTLFLIPTPVSAQTVTDGRAWLTVSVQGLLSKDSPWRWSMDSIARSREGVSQIDTASLRPMLIYNLDRHNFIGGGYAFVSTYPVAGGRTTEHRLFGIYQWSAPSGGGTLSMRVRVEDRMIEANSGVLWRVRPQARFSHPFKTGGRLSWVSWDELSLHLNTTTRSPRGIDQNRAFAGIGSAWSPKVRAEIGYLNQFLPGHGAANRMNHVVSTTMTLSF